MDSKEPKSGVVFLIGLLVTYFVLLALVVPPKQIENVRIAEQKLIRDYLGPRTELSITQRSKSTYRTLFVKTGIVAESYDMFLPDAQAQARSRGMEELGEREGFFDTAREKIDTMWLLVSFSVQRLYAMVIWMPLVGIVIAASIWDGWTRRKIKMVGFEQTSAPIFGLARQGFIYGAFAPLFYFFAPITIHPVFPVVWGCYMAACLMIKASNLQRM